LANDAHGHNWGGIHVRSTASRAASRRDRGYRHFVLADGDDPGEVELRRHPGNDHHRNHAIPAMIIIGIIYSIFFGIIGALLYSLGLREMITQMINRGTGI
jgi:hypothetical protein